MTLLYIWILLFGFVGTQLAWTLRPFFGDPGQDFSLFRSIDGNFYAEILRTIANLFSPTSSPIMELRCLAKGANEHQLPTTTP